MKYILMVMIWYSSHSYSGYTAEFNTLEACKYAGIVSKNSFGGLSSSVFYECVPKGIVP